MPAETSVTPASFVAIGDSALVSCEVLAERAPIVLIHGLGGSRQLWNDLCFYLSDARRIVLYDLRGSGDTQELARRELSLQTWSSDLHELLAELKIERPVLVGHSLGASIALKYALRFPHDVEALVLMAADANLSSLSPRMERSIERIEREGFDEWVHNHWSQNVPFASTSVARAPALIERYREMLLDNNPADYLRTCRAITTAEDLTDQLHEITQPALVIVGHADDRTPLEHGRALASRLENARVVELPDVGHTPPLEAPEEVAAAISTFLADIVDES